MTRSESRIFILLLIFLLTSCRQPVPPAPYGAVPSERQMAWHEMQYYAFIHFGQNTFSDREWGYGDESPAAFQPSALDCMQWARVASEAGMEGIIITAKHHDGFCLWPSAFTEHSVKNSAWKDGKGDVLKELREACDAYGLKMGIYLSPWDRNHADYGTPAYLEYYRAQLRELLINYGELFEVWFDGANGGSGYYGGARENRNIDNTRYYDWKNTHAIVRELQPGAVMFSDGGPDIRWVGNEQGYASETNWCTLHCDAFYPGMPGISEQLGKGHEDGKCWLPAEVDVSIRPGWFYHASQDSMVKSLDQLVDIWFHSVGMNSNLLLNLPPDSRGLIHENDVSRLMELKHYLDSSFAVNLAQNASIRASSQRKGYPAGNCLDGSAHTFWSAKDDISEAWVEIMFPAPVIINTILLREHIPLGQRITSFRIETKEEEGYRMLADGTTIGNRRIARFENTRTSAIRILFTGKACPVITTIEAYRIQPCSAKN